MDKKDRGLFEWLALVKDLRPLYAEFQAAQGSLPKILAVAEKALGVLVARGVTIEEIAGVVTTVGPLVALFVRERN
jgi:hypothetical protein